ncbi:MAG TPA: hypothetical protein VJI68_03255 [Candidatus Nanoarchaeia archaeon]|nr:hypothetical protein [Candidatus Nanoarchaeia archaeon]
MTEEKKFIINLRREFLNAPIYKRGKRSINGIKYFMQQHLKTKIVKIGPELNLKVWENGRQNPPSKVEVKAIVKDGISYVELPGFEFPKEKPKEGKKTKAEVQKAAEKKEESDVKKKKEAELNKELGKEEELHHKKEHDKETIQKPTTSKVKLKEQLAEKSEVQGRIIGETGKKGKK